MAIYRNNKKVSAVYRGGRAVSRIYRGEKLVFQSGSSPDYGNEIVGKMSNSGSYSIRVNNQSIQFTTESDGKFTVPLSEPIMTLENMSTSSFSNNIERIDWIPVGSECTDLSNLMASSSNIKSLYTKNWNTSGVTNFNAMLNGCSSLVKNGMELSIDNAENLAGTFRDCQNLTGTVILSATDIKNSSPDGIPMSNMFYNSGVNEVVFDIDKTITPSGMLNMFYNCKNLTKIDFSYLNPSSTVTNMFDGCNSLNHIRCTQSFKDYLLSNADKAALPATMRDGGSGTWEIID